MASDPIAGAHCYQQDPPDFNWLIWIRPLLPNHCQMIYQVDTGGQRGPFETKVGYRWSHDMQAAAEHDFTLGSQVGFFLGQSSFSCFPYKRLAGPLWCLTRHTSLIWVNIWRRIWSRKSKCIRGPICILIKAPAGRLSCRIKIEFKTSNWIRFTALAVQITSTTLLGDQWSEWRHIWRCTQFWCFKNYDILSNVRLIKRTLLHLSFYDKEFSDIDQSKFIGKHMIL